jgi:hypothetical protein
MDIVISLPIADRATSRGRFGWVIGEHAVAEPEQRPWGYTGTFADPDGHQEEVAQVRRAAGQVGQALVARGNVERGVQALVGIAEAGDVIGERGRAAAPSSTAAM